MHFLHRLLGRSLRSIPVGTVLEARFEDRLQNQLGRRLHQNHEEVLSEFRVSNNDPNVADPSSERILFSVDEPQFNHDGGTVAFGPDGLLYFALGDGGGAHDGLADPYRFSFDDGPGGDGRLFLADVGQNLFEEINIVQKGGNYGWVIIEGFHCFDPFNPISPPASCSGTGPSGEPLRNPIAEYRHQDGLAVIGGFVYRGKESPRLFGKYVFGDFSSVFVLPDGRLFWLDAKSAPSDIFESPLMTHSTCS